MLCLEAWKALICFEELFLLFLSVFVVFKVFAYLNGMVLCNCALVRPSRGKKKKVD